MDAPRRLERTSAPLLPRPGLRFRVLASCHRWVRFGPWLVPLGAVLMLWALSISVVAGAVGAVLVGLGVAASLWQPRLRRRQAHLSVHRRDTGGTR